MGLHHACNWSIHLGCATISLWRCLKIPADVPISTIENFRASKGAAGDWVGILFAGYSLFAAIFSVVMIKIANTFGRKPTYAVSLLLGGLSYLAFLLFKNPEIIQVDLLFASFQVPKVQFC